jgi:hypothetical protein
MQGIEQQRQYTLTQHTTFLVVVRRNNEYTGLVTDKVRVQAVVVTQSSATSRVEYEQHFGTRGKITPKTVQPSLKLIRWSVPEPASVATDESELLMTQETSQY